MKTFVQNMPRLSLSDLLRRRKMTLKRFIDELGITTYEALCIRCDRMGVTAPSATALAEVLPPVPVNNPVEGVVVLEPPRLVSAENGEPLEDEVPPQPFNLIAPGEPIEDLQKKPKKKKEATKEG